MFSVSAKPFWKPLLFTTLLIASGFILGCGKKEPTQSEVLAMAQAQMAAGNHTAATSMLENYLAAHPGAFDVIDRLAFAYAEAGDPAMAAFYFNRAGEIDPAQPEYFLYAAQALEQINDSAGAANSYRKYLTANPDDATVYIQLAEMNAELGNRSAALDAYLQANRHRPDGTIQNAIARLYLESGNQAQAQTWFASAAQSGGTAREVALLGLLEIALRAERFADAEELVQTIDREFPGAIELSPLADSRRQLEEWRDAQENAAEALAALDDPVLGPAIPPPAATAPLDTDPPSVATVEEPAAEAASPSDPEQPAEAPSPEAPPPSPPMDKEQLVAQAEARFETAQLFPAPEEQNAGTTESSDRQREYGNFLEQAREQVVMGNLDQAVRNFQRALARNNSDPEVWRELSETQYQAGDFVRARASASEAVRRAPDDPGYLLQYLRVAQRTLPQSQLLRELEAARNRFPRSGAVALALGRAYDAQGSRGYAGRMYREFLRLAPPDHPDRAEIEALLNN